MSDSKTTTPEIIKEQITLTAEQAQRWSVNTGNKWAWQIASGLAGWMQFCCAKVIGHHIREDPARMALVEILQAQRGNLWLWINALPMSWRKGPANERVDVCLGGEKTHGSAGVIELKWPWTVEEGNRIETRVAMVQDIARLASIETTEAPNIKYFVLGLMQSAVGPLIGNPHSKSAAREAQRTTFGELLSVNPIDPERFFSVADLEKIFADLQARIPVDSRLGDCRIKTTLMAAQELLVGNCELGWVYVWQCDRVEMAQPISASAGSGVTQTSPEVA